MRTRLIDALAFRQYASRQLISSGFRDLPEGVSRRTLYDGLLAADGRMRVAFDRLGMDVCNGEAVERV